MTTKQDPVTGEIEVRVVLYVKVDPKAWAENMMGEHPDELHHRDIRAHVKDYVRDIADDAKHGWAKHSAIDSVPITQVTLESPHPRKEGA